MQHPSQSGTWRLHVDMQLHDVHTMLRLPIRDQPGMEGGCNFASVSVLCSVVAGASTVFFRQVAWRGRASRTKILSSLVVDSKSQPNVTACGQRPPICAAARRGARPDTHPRRITATLMVILARDADSRKSQEGSAPPKASCPVR